MHVQTEKLYYWLNGAKEEDGATNLQSKQDGDFFVCKSLWSVLLGCILFYFATVIYHFLEFLTLSYPKI